MFSWECWIDIQSRGDGIPLMTIDMGSGRDFEDNWLLRADTLFGTSFSMLVYFDSELNPKINLQVAPFLLQILQNPRKSNKIKQKMGRASPAFFVQLRIYAYYNRHLPIPSCSLPLSFSFPSLPSPPFPTTYNGARRLI